MPKKSHSYYHKAIFSFAIFFLLSKGAATSIGYHGNVVAMWERLVEEYERTGDLLVEMGSDQTSCHNPFGGGYYPVQLGFDEANE